VNSEPAPRAQRATGGPQNGDHVPCAYAAFILYRRRCCLRKTTQSSMLGPSLRRSGCW